MQCSCCRQERENLHEYSVSAVDTRNRKTIQTFHLCTVCRVVYLINPLQVAARARELNRHEPQRRRA